MVDLIGLHKHFILEHLSEGDVAVDFTMGNGHDTEFLSKTVGEKGHGEDSGTWPRSRSVDR